MNRISRAELYVGMVKLLAKRSMCTRKHVGCILVKDNRIVAMGYNGVLPGQDPEEGLDEEGNSQTVHAEANVIAFCAKHGIPTEGCNLWITLAPCKKCAELIIQTGISEVYYLEPYRETEGLELLKEYVRVWEVDSK